MQISKYVGDILVVALRGLNGWHRNGFLYSSAAFSHRQKFKTHIYILLYNIICIVGIFRYVTGF